MATFFGVPQGGARQLASIAASQINPRRQQYLNLARQTSDIERQKFERFRADIRDYRDRKVAKKAESSGGGAFGGYGAAGGAAIGALIAAPFTFGASLAAVPAVGGAAAAVTSTGLAGLAAGASIGGAIGGGLEQAVSGDVAGGTKQVVGGLSKLSKRPDYVNQIDQLAAKEVIDANPGNFLQARQQYNAGPPGQRNDLSRDPAFLFSRPDPQAGIQPIRPVQYDPN